jgi:DNA-binding NtrC family response regulator
MTDFRPKRILIVDDDQQLLDLLVLTLSAIGYETVAAAGGAEAVEILARQRFDLMVTDVKMPNLDGISLLKRVRRYYPDMPVLFITGVATPEIISTADPDGFLAKPFRISHIEELIETTLNRERRPGTRANLRRILVVDKDTAFRESVAEALTVGDFLPFAVPGSTDAVRELENGQFDAVIADTTTSADGPMSLVGHVRTIYPDLPIILTGEPPTVLSPAESDVRSYLRKPFAMSEMIALLNELVPIQS